MDEQKDASTPSCNGGALSPESSNANSATLTGNSVYTIETSSTTAASNSPSLLVSSEASTATVASTEPKRAKTRVKASLQNYYKHKLRSAALCCSQHHPSYIQLLGSVNVLTHRLAYLEDKLNCRDEVPTMVLFPDVIGHSSTDEFDSPIYSGIPDLEEIVRAAQTTAQSVNMDLPFSNGSAGSVESLSSGGPADSGGDFFHIRVRIPEIEMQNHLCFRRDRTIWFAKLQLLKSLSKPLIDNLNFGLYLPPANGKAGKFLEEERLFSDYPTDPTSMPFLEFKYKRRVYKQMKLEIKEVKKYHNKANMKAFFESVRSRNVDKINRMTGKCMDPNIQEDSTGETPLTIAASLKGSSAVIQALVGGGAHLDFRARDGKTALHKAVKAGNQKNIELLLSLGASPNYKDTRGLTPLYYNVQSGGESMIAELLLKDRAAVNVSDEQGWKEMHHACRYGRAQHLQLLVYYGADINCQNEAGNTPLHVCAAYDQETAARLVLFRGGDRTVKNKSSQTPFQVAIVSNNFSLGETIRNFSDDDVVIQQEVPTYNTRRRCSSLAASSPGILSRTTSEPFLPGNFPGVQGAGNRMSVASASSFTDDDSIPEESSLPKRSGSVGSMGRSAAVARVVHRKIRDAKSSKHYICFKPYTAQDYGELTLMKGDFVKVHGIGEFNFWEGEVGNCRGWFPSNCIREVTGKERAQTMRERKANYPESSATKPGDPEPRVVFVERKKSGFGFILRGAKSPQGTTTAFKRTKEFPALQYLEHIDKGSPADKAGLKKGDFVLEINGQEVASSPHQYVVSLVVNSPDTIVMKVITVPNSKALVWLNESKKNSLRRKPPTSQPSLTKLKAEKTQQELQAINVLDDAIAKAETPTEDQTGSPFASIRKRPVSQKVSPEHLSSVFQRQASAPTASTPEEHRPNLKKPIIPLAPSAFRFNTVARISSAKSSFPTAASAVSPMDSSTMETQTQFDDDLCEKQKWRNSAESDSALSSLRSSPASSYSYTTSVSNDSGVYTRADTTLSDVASPVDHNILPPAPDYPAPSIPPAPSYPAPTYPNNLRARSQSMHNLKTEQSLSERRMSTGQKRPTKPPPPIPHRDSSISDGDLSRSNSSDATRPSSLDISQSSQFEASPGPDAANSSAFSSAIAEAAAKREKLRKSQSYDSLEAKTPLQLALAARDQSLSGENQNRNQNAETTASQGSPQLALNEAIAKRKAHLDASKQPGENIESKIRKYKQADSAKGNSANQALLTAIAKRRSTIEKQMSEDSDSQSTGSEGSTKLESEKRDSTEPKQASSIREADIAQAAAVMQSRLASKPPVKEPVNSFAGHKNAIKIVPRGESSKPSSPASQSPRERVDETTPDSPVQALKHGFDKSPRADTYKHPLSPVKENEGDISSVAAGFRSSNGPPTNGHADTDSSPQLPPLGDHRRERSFDTASVVSSMSSMSTMSSYSTMSTEPSSDIFEQDEDDSRTNTMKSTSSSSSSSTLTSKTTKPSPKVLPKPKRKPQLMEDDPAPPPREALDNEGSLVISNAPSSDVDNKQSMLSAWTEGTNANQNEEAEGWKTKRLAEWTSHDVGLWLASLNLSEHRRSFEENEIAGEHLSSLTKDDLQELGVGRMGHRLTICKAVQRLTSGNT